MIRFQPFLLSLATFIAPGAYGGSPLVYPKSPCVTVESLGLTSITDGLRLPSGDHLVLGTTKQDAELLSLSPSFKVKSRTRVHSNDEQIPCRFLFDARRDSFVGPAVIVCGSDAHVIDTATQRPVADYALPSGDHSPLALAARGSSLLITTRSDKENRSELIEYSTQEPLGRELMTEVDLRGLDVKDRMLVRPQGVYIFGSTQLSDSTPSQSPGRPGPITLTRLNSDSQRADRFVTLAFPLLHSEIRERTGLDEREETTKFRAWDVNAAILSPTRLLLVTTVAWGDQGAYIDQQLTVIRPDGAVEKAFLLPLFHDIAPEAKIPSDGRMQNGEVVALDSVADGALLAVTSQDRAELEVMGIAHIRGDGEVTKQTLVPEGVPILSGEVLTILGKTSVWRFGWDGKDKCRK